jgi:diguanylate cyclase (GGDEF)-like protein
MKPFHPEEFLILIVDDIPQNLQVIGDILEDVGYETTFATSGEQALERAKIAHPDLILLDLMMPEMNGLQVCEHIKSDPKLAVITIIFLTASNEKNHLIQAFNLGAVDYITKPFNPQELLSRVRTHLELKSTRDQLKEALQQQFKLTQELEKLATIDALTQVWNRRQLLQIGQHEINRAKRYNRDLSVLMIDIDHFKKINDTYGHGVGDEVLKTVAQTMLKSIRIADRLGRFGGEEFVIFLPESDSKGANHLAERIRKIIANLIISAPDVDFSLTVSIGVATYQNHQSLEDVIKRADDALYQAKNQGRNRVVMAESDQP